MKLNLQRKFFTETKKELITYGNFKLTAFSYSSGVSGIRNGFVSSMV